MDLVHPTAGTATIGGRHYRDLASPNRHVGAVLEATSFHPARRARAHLKMIAIASGIEMSRVDEMLDVVGLAADAKRRVGGFSMGMRQRLELAGALLGDPGVLILDEPSNGLDPQGIAWLRDFLRHLAAEGRTVLVSSHLLAEMALTVDDVVIISLGEVKAYGPLSSLIAEVRPSIKLKSPEVDRLMAVVQAAGFAPRRVALDTVVVDGVGPQQLGPVLAHHQVVVYEMYPEGNDLESLFFQLTESLGFTQQPVPAPGQYPRRAGPRARRSPVTRLVRAEVFKLRTTPGPWVILGINFVFMAFIMFIIYHHDTTAPALHRFGGQAPAQTVTATVTPRLTVPGSTQPCRCRSSWHWSWPP